MTKVYLDTNVFLHFKWIAEIDWRGLTKSDGVELVVAPIVIGELDKKKDGVNKRKIRKRAADVIRRLSLLLEADANKEIREKVRVQFEGTEPAIDYEHYGLERERPDDRLLAAVVAAKENHSEVWLATSDLGLKIKAKHQEVEVLTLPEESKLATGPDPVEIENARLIQELAQLRQAYPRLAMTFDDGAQLRRQEISLADVDQDAVSGHIAKIKEEHPKMEWSKADPPRRGEERLLNLRRIWVPLDPVSKDEVRLYNQELEEFYRKYEDYLWRLERIKARRSRIASIGFEVNNAGGAPATDVDITLSFSRDVPLLGKLEGEKLPDPPELPTEPGDRFGQLRQDVLRHHPWDSYHILCPPGASNTSGPHVPTAYDRTDRNEVTYSIGRVKHGFSVRLKPVYVDFGADAEPKGLSIDYWMMAGNHPVAFEGKLNVRVDVAEVSSTKST